MRLVELGLNELLPYFDSRYPVAVDEGDEWPTLAVPMDDRTTEHIPSRTGVMQGDVLGPLFFAVGLDAVICKALEGVPLQDVPSFLAAFIDDINVVARKDIALAFAAALERACRDLQSQLFFNHDKCALYEPRAEQAGSADRMQSDEPGNTVGADSEFQCHETHLGVTVLGTPIGDPEYCKAFWETTTASIAATIKRIETKVADPQIKLLLLRHCGVTKGVFLARMADPVLARQFGSDLDVAACDALASALKRSADSSLGGDEQEGDMLRQARLPVRHGGLGVTSIRECALAAHLGALAAAANVLRKPDHDGVEPTADAAAAVGADAPTGSDDGAAEPVDRPVGSMEAALLQWYQEALSPHGEGYGLLDDFWKEVARLQDAVEDKLMGGPGAGRKSKLTLPKCLQVDEKELEKLPRTAAELIAEDAGDRLQHRLSDVLHRLQLAHIYLSSSTQERIKILSMTQRGASAYLNAIPTESGLTIPPHFFTWLVRRRLGCNATRAEDRLVARECTCRSGARGKEQSQEQHAFNCKLRGGNQRRHDRLRDTIADMFRMAGFAVHIEPRAKYPMAFGQGGPDLEVFSFPSAGIDTLLKCQ